MTHGMDRIALLLIAALTGLGALFAIYLGFTTGDDSLGWRCARSLAAVLMIGISAVTWHHVLSPSTARHARLKRVALVPLFLGIVGLAANAIVASRTNDPDGPVFALSLLLILQAFVTIAYAGRGR
jgi:cytochrome bd-type quinol oxidase subunit 2